MADIVLTTQNARFSHTAFGLRYLLANLGELADRAELMEFSLEPRPHDIAEKLLKQQPVIIGISVYIWNITEITALVRVLKTISRDTQIILGGPEVSFENDLPEVAHLADYVIQGPGEASFRELCQSLLEEKPPEKRIHQGKALPLEQLKSPYPYYTQEDIQHRFIYVEASRGCPFRCEFCLSSLDVTAKAFPLQPFLTELDALYQRGARQFKFIDRTFNLKTETTLAILTFFLERNPKELDLHFELIPDHLPEKLKTAIAAFPKGSLQFEIGVQTLEPNTQTLIQRKQDNVKTLENLKWLRVHSQAHIHTDLILGLPGDTLQSIANSFDQLIQTGTQEIQVGILKRLRGAPINRHTKAFEMRYDPMPPYSILSNQAINFMTMQRLNRFARFWDLIGNSGRFSISLPSILAEAPFDRFLQLSDSLYHRNGSTWQIALRRLYDLVFDTVTEDLSIEKAGFREHLARDFLASGEKGIPNFLLTEEKPSGSPQSRSRNLRQNRG